MAASVRPSVRGPPTVDTNRSRSEGKQGQSETGIVLGEVGAEKNGLGKGRATRSLAGSFRAIAAKGSFLGSGRASEEEKEASDLSQPPRRMRSGEGESRRRRKGRGRNR